MVVGKNKGLMKSGKKGSKKKVVDPFTRKDWYDVRAPAVFKNRDVGKTLVNRTQGSRIASDALKGRVYEVSLTDLQADADSERGYRKFGLVCEDVQGKACLTNFHSMNLTADKRRSIVKKWQTLIEAYADARTTDGYLLRCFCIGFTKKQSGQQCKTSYAQAHKIRLIRKKMKQIMVREVSSCDLKAVVNKLIPDAIAADVTKACNRIYPLQDVYVRKVKVLKRPKFDLNKLMDMHNDAGSNAATAASGEVVDRPEGYEPPVQDLV